MRVLYYACSTFSKKDRMRKEEDNVLVRCHIFDYINIYLYIYYIGMWK